MLAGGFLHAVVYESDKKMSEPCRGYYAFKAVTARGFISPCP
jgi:hypothetical protein